MQIKTLIFFSFFCIVILSNTIFNKLEPQFKKLTQLYQEGDTSGAYSIAMKLYLSLQTMKEQIDIDSPKYQSDVENINCQQTLSQVVGLVSANNWIELYEQIHNRLQYLQKSCTNRDFDYNSIKLKQLRGFDDKCALCVVILKVMENYISYNARSVTDFVQRQFCDKFDGITRPTCQAFIHYAGPTIIRSFLAKQSSDVICLKIGFCTNKECRISQQLAQKLNFQIIQDKKPAPWDWLVHIFVDKFGDGHLPPFDLDNDTFSDVSTFRGYKWRGADCDELNSKIYPGRKAGNKILDQDCNGIYGITPKGKTYQELYCSQTNTKSKRLGVAVIGDSAGAHFSIPQKYFNASMIKKGTYNDLLVRVADQLDLPHLSAYTGNTYSQSPSHSIYKYLRNWNLCNNNDYQNLGVNGGDSGNSWGNIKALNRDQTNDYPLLMFLQLIGNDVCAKSFNSMTKVQDFKRNILRLLNWLDTTVPADSHLMILGLADGQILYDNLHDSIHPLNVTYSTVYDFLNCLKISPCWGWLNSNATVRRFATQRAQNLSLVYKQIIAQTKFKNFDIVYYDFPAWQIIQRKVLQGGDPKDLIERCDGFHPNGQFQSDLADWIWFKIQQYHPQWIGEKNPHNEQIRKIFGLKDLH